MLSSSTCSITDLCVTRIEEACVQAEQPAPTSSIYGSLSSHTVLLPPSHRIAEKDISVCRCEETAMELRDIIEKPDVRNVPLPPGLI